VKITFSFTDNYSSFQQNNKNSDIMTIQKIKEISIRDYLRDYVGIKPHIQNARAGMYFSPFRAERTASFKVDYRLNLWHDFGSGEGGSIIDLVMKLKGFSFSEAVRRLGEGEFSYKSATSDTPPQNIADSKLTITYVRALEHPALIGYLESRAINIDIAKKYCREVNYTITHLGRHYPYFAVGFENNLGGWELRNKNFKGCVSPKFPYFSDKVSNTVMIFEGFMDFLSYLTLKGSSTPRIDTVVLNSVNNLHKAMDFLKTHRTVHAFLDNDDAGHQATTKLILSLTESEVIDQSPFYRNHKDVNEYLVGTTIGTTQELTRTTKRCSGLKM
jgi:DNA primase